MAALGTPSDSSTSRLQVCINQIDHYMAVPGPLDNSTLPRVPIIRIYGSSSVGNNACLHIHQVYPYFYIEYSGDMHPKLVKRYIAKLTHSLNHAIALSLKRDPQSPKSKYIRAIILVKGVHFYGFHSSFTPFLKIYVTDPALISRTATMLQSGMVMSSRFRIYESHLSYILQFMCDFGLSGCGLIELEGALQRCTEGDTEMESDEKYPSSFGLASFNSSPHYRQTRMSLEVDAISPQILNRRRLTARNLHHKLEIPQPPSTVDPLVLGVRELWEDERNRRRLLGLNPSPEIPVDPSDSSRGRGGDWVAEARWWDEIRRRIEEERTLDFAQAEISHEWEQWIMTTFESIEALWEQPWKTWKPPNHRIAVDRQSTDADSNLLRQADYMDINDEFHLNANEGSTHIDVDVALLSSQEIEQGDDLGEEKWDKFDINDYQNELDGEAEWDKQDEDLQEVTADDGATMEIPEVDPSSPQDPFIYNDESLDSSQTRDYRLPSPCAPQSHPQHIPSVNDDILSTPSKSASLNHEAQVAFDDASPIRLHLPSETSEGDFNHRDGAVQASTSDGSEFQRGLESKVYNQRIFNHPGPILSPKQVAAFDFQGMDDNSQSRKKRKISHNFDEGDGELSGFITDNLQNQPSNKRDIASSKPTQLPRAFKTCKAFNPNKYTYKQAPPSVSDLMQSMGRCNIPEKIYRAPYYSRNSDVPEKTREYAGLSYRLRGEGIADLEHWIRSRDIDLSYELGNVLLFDTHTSGWEYASGPPSNKEVRKWLALEQYSKHTMGVKLNSQIEGPTQANIYGHKTSPTDTHGIRAQQNMSIFSLEIFAPSNNDKMPDPESCKIAAAFYAFHITGSTPNHCGILVSGESLLHKNRDAKIDKVDNELDLLNRLIDLVADLDPDIVVGWEVQNTSWGYFNARARTYGLNVAELMGRAPPNCAGGGIEQWGSRTTSNFKIPGRHVFNLWRIMRAEENLTSYSFENVAFHVLRLRVPKYSASTLTEWFNSPVSAHASHILRYFSRRAAMNLEIMDEVEIVTKTAEFARVFGVDFFSVISRGSQFKVESFLFRIAKPESLVLISPSKNDVGKQNAAECMPLIIEPLSAFYSSPLVVLDFQSLYPSIMIAYNYCYSTCLGRVTDFKGNYKFGVIDDMQLQTGILEKLQDYITVAPNGILYVNAKVRRGLLGRMLTELLETRVMVKQAMKGTKSDKALRRILDARQLSLKYIANVTYGYTSASYSGRMPAVEIADSIVQSGRETLEKAIDVVESTAKWGAKVVYGDTDSMFIYLKGKTKDQAFRIGHDIADTITAMNPAPVKLKFEKVYLPCVLMAKKRYVGFKYENIDDETPGFDAKGIETVRRDGVLAQRKMTENCLKILFRSQDLSEVKEYCCSSWEKLLENRVSVQDFIFAKEVKMGTYSDKVPPPPGVMVAARRMLQDPNNEPQYGERVPYVIACGSPGSRLVDRAVDPLELINNSHLRLDANYYITRVLIPPLERIFNLVGADVRQWFLDMRKVAHQESSFSPSKVKERSGPLDRMNIDEHFGSTQCLVCRTVASQVLCDDCLESTQETITDLCTRISVKEKRLVNAHYVCASCTGSAPAEPIYCESLDCPWFYSRKKAEAKMNIVALMEDVTHDLEIEELEM